MLMRREQPAPVPGLDDRPSGLFLEQRRARNV